MTMTTELPRRLPETAAGVMRVQETRNLGMSASRVRTRPRLAVLVRGARRAVIAVFKMYRV
jgi:hypothetical protein